MTATLNLATPAATNARSWWFVHAPADGAYRPDIDALRAVAVGLVILYHLGIDRLAGGFVGVDVFFVISGFLIGALILGEMQAGRFSIVRFYERRIRRIFPALIAVLIATTLLGWYGLYPVPFRNYGTSLAAAAASLSNLYFWQTSGYLAGVGTSRALLHTWSLAVEEQFYILFPPFMILVRRLAPGRTVLAISAVALLSFGLAVVGVMRDANTAFYLPHTRAWELLLGVLIAAWPGLKIARPWLRAALALTGLALIAGAAIFYNSRTPFPGLAALPPCLGAALVILAHRDGGSWVSRAMTFRPFVFIGLISYSLYLWHWPLIVLYREYFGVDTEHFTRTARAVLGVLTIGLSIFSWWFVERPFRRAAASRGVVFGLAGAAAVLTVAGGLLLTAANGAPGRYPPEVIRLASYLEYDSRPQYRTGTCFLGARETFSDFPPQVCLKRDPGRPSALLLGDSYGAHLYAGLADTLKDRSLLQATARGCKPSLRPPSGDEDCRRLAHYVFETYLPQHPVDMLIVSARWMARDRPDLGDLIDWAHARGIAVVVVGAPPEYDSDLPSLLARGILAKDPGFAPSHLNPASRRTDAMMAAFVAQRGARYASAYSALCGGGPTCEVRSDDGAPLQFDYGHLTRDGSELVARRLAAGGAFDLNSPRR